jgi:dTMP kinase
VSMQRLSAARSPDKFESESAEFFERLRVVYIDRAKENPLRFRVINADQSLDKVKSLVEEAILSI